MQRKGVSFGRYDLLKRIARGGMAEIFIAIERGIEGVNRNVVVKRILPQMAESDDFITMFMDEARVAARLAHPNIAHIYNFGEVDGVYFLAMEYVEGLTVARVNRLNKSEGLPLDMSLRIMSDVCAGLHYAHEMCDEHGRHLGVVHRDVSPQNIMVSRNGEAKVLDFGVAHAATKAHVTGVGQLKGKLAYMSPEQFRGAVIDRRTDVFAAGAVLYEMLVGRQLFGRENEGATMHALIYEDPPKVSEIAAPTEVALIIRKAVAKNPDHRYQTMQEMGVAIDDYIDESRIAVTSRGMSKFVGKWLEAAAKAKARRASERKIPDGTPSGVDWQASAARRLDDERTENLRRGGHDDSSADRDQLSGGAMMPLDPPALVLDVDESGAISQPSLLSQPSSSGDSGYVSEPSLPSDPSGGSLPSSPSLASTTVPPVEAPGRASEQRRSGGRRVLIIGALLGLGVIAAAGFGLMRASGGSDGDGEQSREASLSSTAPGVDGLDSTRGDDAGALATVEPVAIPDAGRTHAGGGQGDAAARAAADAAPDAGEVETVEGPQPPTKRRIAALPPGKLFMITRPWAKVHLGARNLGTTPLIDVPVPPGAYKLRLVDANGKTHHHRIRIRSGQPTKVFLNLQASSGGQ